VKGAPGVRCSARTSATGYLLHLYNLNVVRRDDYHDAVEPAGKVEVSWVLPKAFKARGLKLECLSPDPEGSSGTLPFEVLKVGGRTTLTFTVPNLHIWSVIRATPV
jgi:hypothetical protein